MNTLFEKIRRIHFNSKKLADAFLAGSYRSVFKGRGIEFDEVRAFTEGDEIRDIDWYVTARMQQPYVKVFREERDLDVMLLVDLSASTRFRKKNDQIAEIAALLALSAVNNHDQVGLILFSDQVEKFLPVRRDTQYVLRMIREVLQFQAKRPGTDLVKALEFYGKVQKQRGICFILSDFLCPDFSHPLKLLAKKHDVICLAIQDPFEQAFPNCGLISLKSLETGETALIDTADPLVREHYKAEREREQKALLQTLKLAGCDVVEISSDEPYLPRLQKFFKIRELKKR